MITLKLRQFILRRDKFTCQICRRSSKDGVKLEVDHKKPKAKGGEDLAVNLWTLCFDCNRGKQHHWNDDTNQSEFPKGRYFMAYENGELSWSGYVYDIVNGVAVVGIHDCLMGYIEYEKLVKISDMTEWKFYSKEGLECALTNWWNQKTDHKPRPVVIECQE